VTRVINRWNALDGETVSSSSIDAFKNRLNEIRMTIVIGDIEQKSFHTSFERKRQISSVATSTRTNRVARALLLSSSTRKLKKNK